MYELKFIKPFGWGQLNLFKTVDKYHVTECFPLKLLCQ